MPMVAFSTLATAYVTTNENANVATTDDLVDEELGAATEERAVETECVH